MTAVDTNILVYAHRADSTRHKAAEETVRELAFFTKMTVFGKCWSLC